MTAAWITRWIFELMRFPKQNLTAEAQRRREQPRHDRALVSSASLRLCGKFSSLVSALVITTVATAQAPLSDLIFTVGTTIQAQGGQDWSYVLVGSVDPALLRGKQFAVYGKAGDPASASAFAL